MNSFFIHYESHIPVNVEIQYKKETFKFIWKLPIRIHPECIGWTREKYFHEILNIIHDCGDSVSRSELLMTLKSYGFIYLNK